MDTKLICFVVCTLLSLCESAYVDTIKKCSFKDDECVRSLIQKMMKDTAESGISELNLHPYDPKNITDLSFSILDFLTILVEEGTLTGIKDCEIKHIHNNFDIGETQLDLVCDLTIKAKFKLIKISPLIQKLLGQEAVDGNGNVILKIDKIHIKMTLFYHVVKNDDGDIYFDLRQDELISSFEVDNMKLTATKILLGKQDLSEFIEKLFNEYWKYFMSTFGKIIFEVAINIMKGILGDFLEKVPAKYYYTEDLTSYVKKWHLQRITIISKFALGDLSPLIKSFFGHDSPHATDNVNVKIDNLLMQIQIYHYIIKKEDGELYFTLT